MLSSASEDKEKKLTSKETALRKKRKKRKVITPPGLDRKEDKEIADQDNPADSILGTVTASALGAQAMGWLNKREDIHKKCVKIQSRLSGRWKADIKVKRR